MLINEDARQRQAKHSRAYTKSVLKIPARKSRRVSLNRLVAHKVYWEDSLAKSYAPNDAQFSEQVATGAFKPLNGVVLGMLALLIVLVISSVGLVIQGYHQRAQVAALAELQAERDALQAELTRLTLEQNTLTSLDRVETLSRQALGMRYPETKNIVVVKTKSDDISG